MTLLSFTPTPCAFNQNDNRYNVPVAKKIILWCGVLISGFCLYWALRGISFADTLTAVKEARISILFLSLLTYITGYWMRAVRWETLMRPVKHVPAKDLFSPLILGFFGNNILPLRMGEILRAHWTGKKLGISRTSCLATIFMERLYDTISFLLTFLAVTLFFPFPESIEHGAYALGGACIATLIVLILSLCFQSHVKGLIEKLPLPHPLKSKILNLYHNFMHGASGTTKPSHVLIVFLQSLVIWTLEGTTLYIMVHAFPVTFAYPQAFFLLFMLGLSALLPQAPGYVGTVELAGTAALGLCGIPRAQALPIILTIHAFQFTFIVILGFISLSREGLSLRQLIHTV